jgi:hypothetical protein
MESKPMKKKILSVPDKASQECIIQAWRTRGQYISGRAGLCLCLDESEWPDLKKGKGEEHFISIFLQSHCRFSRASPEWT